MAKPISTPIVADLPENWTNGQTVAANGADAGLSQQHGYNYLNSKVNEALEDISVLNDHAGTAYTTTNKPTASDVGAVPTTRTVNNKALSSNISLAASDVGAVPTTRTVNGKALSANITLTASDVSARPSTWTPTASQVSAGTFTGKVQANATAMATTTNAQVRDIYAGTTDMTPKTSALATGTIYVVYE